MPGLIIAGLGPGDPSFLTRAVWDSITAASELYLRTACHPCVQHLPASTQIHSFDSLYETSESYEDVYQTIISEILAKAASDDVLYAVPGDPMVGESTGIGLVKAAAEAGIPCTVLPGISFMEACLRELCLDALNGLVLIDALEVNQRGYPPFSPDIPVLISQVYSRFVASDLKLNLMALYPDEHEITLLHAAGSDEAEMEILPLHEIDHSTRIGSMTTLFVPPSCEPASLESFAGTIAVLREPDGCPWDREQTHQTLRPHLLEEAYETLQALDEEDMDSLEEELGDLLLQIVLHAQIAMENEEFSMADVIRGINRKIIRRHPHVFGSGEAKTAEEVLGNWELIKSEEHAVKRGLFDGIPESLPALSQAEKMQQRAARVSFDWDEISGVRCKIDEELAELDQASGPVDQKLELGDLLFTVVNLARWLEIDAEDALRVTNRRFRRRFLAVEEKIREAGRSIQELSSEELNLLWEQVKQENSD